MILSTRRLLPAVLILTVGLTTVLTVPLQAQTATTATFSITGEPMAGILQAGDGNFYSISVPIGIACKSDATKLCSYIYQVTPTGNASVFYPFQPVAANGAFINSDGFMPVALIAGTDGNLYGACLYGGPSGGGTIFKLTGGVFSIVKSFSASDPGASPNSLIEGADGNFYFTNTNGVYQLTPAGVVTTVFTFPSDNSKGNNASSLMQGSDNNFYVTVGTAPGAPVQGGDVGAIVQISPAGQWNLVHSFAPDASEGKIRGGPLAQAKDGTLFGVAETTGNTLAGTVFQVSPGGLFKLIHTFPVGIVGHWNSALFLGSDGNFYGVTLQGGDTTSANCTILPTHGCGTVYQVTPSGTFSILHNFEGGKATSFVVADNPQVDGGGPTSPLVQGPGGIFYGAADGVGGSQTVFSLTLQPAVPSPVQLVFTPDAGVVGSPVELTWNVTNAFSETQQVCGATVTGSPSAAGAGRWEGPQVGTLVNGVYGGAATITPTAAGTYTYALTCGGKESGFATLVVVGSSPLQIQTTGLPKGTVSQPYLAVLSATGGMSPYFWVVGGTLPKGLAFDPGTGTLSGTPLQFGDYPLVFGVEDSTTPDPERASVAFHLIVDSGLTLSPNVPGAVVGKPYTQALDAQGGLPPYTWQLTSGTLPPGLQFNTSSGVISGTPTADGTSTFAITVLDAENPKAKVTESFTISTAVPPLEIKTPTNLPDATVGSPYSVTLAAVGGTTPYVWTLGPNTGKNYGMPAGLSLSTDGVISGTPVQFQQLEFIDVTVTDSENPKVSTTTTLKIVVKSSLMLTTTALPNAVVGVPYFAPLNATGGIPPYQWFASSDPPPQTLGNIFVFLGGPDNADLEGVFLLATVAKITLIVEDSEQQFASASITLPLTILPPLFPTTTTLASSNTAAGTGESVTFTATVVQTGAGPATGQVVFNSGTTAIGTATLDVNGKATLQTSFSTAGVYSITAVYGGSGTLATSISAAVTETVVTPTISAAVSPGSLTIKSGSSGELTITLTPAGDYSGTVKFSCGTLPAHVSCSFAPPSLTIAAGSGPVTDVLTVSTNAPQTAMLVKPLNDATRSNLFAASTFSLPGLLTGMIVLVRSKRRRAAPRNLWMAAMLCLFCVAALSSCAGGAQNKAAAGTYKIPIALTVSGGATQNINATVVVE